MLFNTVKIKFVSSESGIDTIGNMLSAYEIGRKLHALRMKKKMGLVDLGRHTGLSASLLSQLETGKLVPTLPTLARISMVFDVGLDYFFADRRRSKLFVVVKDGERLRFPDRPDGHRPAFFFECLAYSAHEKSLQAYLAEFPQRSSRDVTVHFHEGAEFVHVLEGTLAILFEEDEHLLTAGDSVYFDASEPHGYRGAADGGAKAIVVTTPPRL